MTDSNTPKRPLRRRFLKIGGAAAASVVTGHAASAEQHVHHYDTADTTASHSEIVPFFAANQAGIITAQQNHTYIAAFDLVTDKREDVIELLKVWTNAAARMTQGDTAMSLGQAEDQAPLDSGEALGLMPARLTLTFGFGPGLFSHEGRDRYGVAQKRPTALVDLPRFNGDQLMAEKTGGDIVVQACADDAQVAFHAIRQLGALGFGVAVMRWGQSGFLSGPTGETPRILMGFKDGTNNPSAPDQALMEKLVWVNGTDAPWMRGGTYTVLRRIRMTLGHWDRTELGFQEQVFGRHKYSGAPLGKEKEFDAVNLEAQDSDGNLVLAENSHVRLSNPGSNGGAQMFRRTYSYNDGTNFYIERWPPWRQETEYDAGLIFIAHQSDPRTAFIPINERLSKFDMMNQFTTHVGSAIYACPPGATRGSYIGVTLFES